MKKNDFRQGLRELGVLMSRPKISNDVTATGGYIKLGDDMDVDWERYAKDLDNYINELIEFYKYV